MCIHNSLSNPSDPFYTSTINTENAWAVALTNNYAFIADEDKVLIYKKRFSGEVDRVLFYKHLLMILKAKSVLFLGPFYKTRTLRFYLDRYFEELNINTFVQYEKNINSKELAQWWKKTTYANLFLEEYLLMSYYFLNKSLWTNMT